jgi:TonB family protein
MDAQLMFAPLATPPHSRWKSLLIGWGVQAQFVVAVLVFNAIAPQPMQQAKKYVMTNLIAPVEPIKEGQPMNPRLARIPTRQAVLSSPSAARLIVPHQVRNINQTELDVAAPEIKVFSKTPAFPALPGVPAGKVIATNTFTSPTSVPPKSNKTAAQVQTGGFGEPNGIAEIEGGEHGANISADGNPGLPIGSGFGNGLGGAVKGVPGSGIPGKHLQSSGFDTQYASPRPKQVLIATNELGSPVEIVEKPKPSYTEEGRKHGVEGEVRLEVQFTADGHVRVLRVLQRLGFGLDEQALHCAEHIRFKPATHGGRPIDSTAVVHIVFELAS